MQGWIFDIRSRTFVLLTAAFVVISLAVLYGITDGPDSAASVYLYSVSGNAAIDLALAFATEVSDVFYMLVFSIVLIIPKRTRRIGIALMILLVLCTLVTGYVKCGVDRSKPGLDFAGHPFPMDLSSDVFPLFCEGGYGSSYPAGHAARAAAFGIVLAFVLSGRFPRGCYLLLLYPALVSASRVYLLEHYPVDVVGGVVLGAMLAGVMARKTNLDAIFGSR